MNHEANTSVPPEALGTRPRLAVLVAVFLVGSVALQYYAHHLRRSLASKKEGAASSLVQKEAPGFTLNTLPTARAVSDPQPMSLAEHRGKIVFISFWASWCRPCDYELPVLNQFYRQNRERNIQVLAISTDAKREAALEYAEKRDFEMPMLWDEGGEVAKQYEVEALPTLVVVDPRGTIRSIERGVRYDMESWLRSKVDQLQPKTSAGSADKD